MVTDWNPTSGMHKLTYFFGTSKEEYEDCNLEVGDGLSGWDGRRGVSVLISRLCCAGLNEGLRRW